MRVCKRCGMEKTITNYRKKGENKWRTTCKQCEAIVRKMRRISEKMLTNQNNVESRGTLCWRCKKAVGRCAWTELDRSKNVRFEPVPGDATIRREAELVGAPFRRGGRNAEMWQRKIMEWANADSVDIHTADAQSEEHTAKDAPLKADKPQIGVKLLHARLELSGDREALLENLRVLMPDEGQVTVEW